MCLLAALSVVGDDPVGFIRRGRKELQSHLEVVEGHAKGATRISRSHCQLSTQRKCIVSCCGAEDQRIDDQFKKTH